MKIHEYQAKEILRAHGVAVPRGKLVQSAEEAVAAARELMTSGNGVVVVKAQIHAGGRGKGGGVKLARSPEEAGEIFKKMMGMQLVTHQTAPRDRRSRKSTSKRAATSPASSTSASPSIARSAAT